MYNRKKFLTQEKIFSYVVIGIINTIFSYFSFIYFYFLFKNFVDLFFITLFSAMLNILFSFFNMKYFYFKTKNFQFFNELKKYYILYIFLFLASYAILFYGIKVYEINIFIVHFINIVVNFMLSYLLNHIWVFK